MSEDYDYRLEDPSAERIDSIAATKILVAKTGVSEAEAESIFNKEKIEVFKGIFKRPKEADVVIKGIKKSFEPYLIIGGEYELRYLTEQTYDLDLNDDAVSVFILGEELIVPEETEEVETEVEIKGKKKGGFFDGLFSRGGKQAPKAKAELQIKGIENVHIKKEIIETKNYKGVSINPDSLSDVEFTEVTEAFFQTDATMVSQNYYDIETLTANIILEYTEKPENVQRVLYEKITITDKKIVFYPVFWAEMVYKGSKEKNVRLDAVTRKIEEEKGTRFAPPPSFGGVVAQTQVMAGHCPECQKPIEDDDTFCENCGVKLS